MISLRTEYMYVDDDRRIKIFCDVWIDDAGDTRFEATGLAVYFGESYWDMDIENNFILRQVLAREVFDQYNNNVYVADEVDALLTTEQS